MVRSRQLWRHDCCTEGLIPDALLGVPQSWTPGQIRQSGGLTPSLTLSRLRGGKGVGVGDLAGRRHTKFVPARGPPRWCRPRSRSTRGLPQAPLNKWQFYYTRFATCV
jgi:hypothetical protein